MCSFAVIHLLRTLFVTLYYGKIEQFTSHKSQIDSSRLDEDLVQTQKILPNLIMIMIIHNVELEFDTRECRQWTPDWLA